MLKGKFIQDDPLTHRKRLGPLDEFFFIHLLGFKGAFNFR